MKNAIVIVVVVLCSIWLLWIKLHTANPIDVKKTSVVAASSTTSQPSTEREAYQALSRLVRVFESDLVFENLTPITAVLNDALPQLGAADRYRIYEQLDQAIHAYVVRLNRQQSGLLKRYRERRQQLWQQVSAQDQPQSEQSDQRLLTDDIAAEPAASEAEVEPARHAALNLQQAQQQFKQQWPQFLKQGLSNTQQQLLDALAKQHIQIVYAGQGVYEFRLNPTYWVEHVAPHLAKADQVYFKQWVEQIQQPYVDDVGMSVDWLVLGTQAHAWAEYVRDYPDGYFTELAQAKRDHDLNMLLTGMDNTPTHELGVLLPEVKAAYDQLTQQYPNSHVSRTLALFEQQLAEQPDDVPAAARRAIALAKDQISR